MRMTSIGLPWRAGLFDRGARPRFFRSMLDRVQGQGALRGCKRQDRAESVGVLLDVGAAAPAAAIGRIDPKPR